MSIDSRSSDHSQQRLPSHVLVLQTSRAKLPLMIQNTLCKLCDSYTDKDLASVGCNRRASKIIQDLAKFADTVKEY